MHHNPPQYKRTLDEIGKLIYILLLPPPWGEALFDHPSPICPFTSLALHVVQAPTIQA